MNFLNNVIRSITDNFSKILTISGISYFFGFIITRSYLLSYGVNDIDLLETKYISAGFFFLVNIGFISLPFLFLKFNSDSSKELLQDLINNAWCFFVYFFISYLLLYFCNIETITSINMVFLLLITVLLFMIVLCVNKNNSDDIFDLKRFLSYFAQIMIGIFIAHVFLYLAINDSFFDLFVKLFQQSFQVFLNSLWNYLKGYYNSLATFWLIWYTPLLIIIFSVYVLLEDRDEFKNFKQDTYLLLVNIKYWLVGTITILSLLTIQSYSYFIYPKVSGNLGGGDYTKVQLVLSKKNDDSEISKEILDHLQIFSQDTEGSALTTEVYLIGKTTEHYYFYICNICSSSSIDDSWLNIHNHKAIQINKKDVLSIINK